MTISQEFKIIKIDDSIKATLLKNYINFEGRSSRVDYIWWSLFTLVVNIILNLINPKLTLISNVIFFFPGISLAIRRLHDTNKSGWNQLWVFTLIGIFPLIYWMIIKAGDLDDNRYGENPFSTISLDKF